MRDQDGDAAGREVVVAGSDGVILIATLVGLAVGGILHAAGAGSAAHAVWGLTTTAAVVVARS